MRIGKIVIGFLLASLVSTVSTVAAAAGGKGAKPATAKSGKGAMTDPATKESIVSALVKKHGAGEQARIERGVTQVLSLWKSSDGDALAFCEESFAPSGPAADALLARLEYAFEMMDGHFLEIGRELRRTTDLDVGPLTPIDTLLSALDPSAHLTEDLFASKVGFVALLNFPLTTLAERLSEGGKWDRKTWAQARLAGRFSRRVPGEVQQAVSTAGSAAEIYISQYNIWMHHVVDAKGERLFPKGLRLITHWNLRDELKGDYADPSGRGLEKQRTILKVMERIVTQSIPAAVIDNPRLDWNPFTNIVSPAPAGEIEADAPAVKVLAANAKPSTDSGAPEPDTRYERLLAQVAAQRLMDPYSPSAPTAIARSFELQREIPEERVTAMMRQILESPLVPRVAALIEKKLGRKLEPQDIWFNGFQARGKFSEPELDAITQRRYPTAEAFAREIPTILGKLGFARDKAEFLAAHIVVDPSRGAGHALQAARRGDFPHLRTRVEKDGMNYKGYNIAVHELGHNVEQVFSLYEVDHTLLQGVPNNAFTEALAFVFQAKDLELLGLSKPDPESDRMRVLNDFWQTWEIAGVALVDIAVWHWMYDHPGARPAELKDAVVRIAREHWNRYYAPVLGQKDAAQLGIYSHMISYPIYLCDYVIGHMIAFQIEEKMKRAAAGAGSSTASSKGSSVASPMASTMASVGVEFERMARFGSVTPDLWMVNATGAPVGPEPLLRATEAALVGAR